MPKRQQYESDDGFVEDIPQGKKRKSIGNEMKKQAGKATVSTETQKDDDGNEYWEISGRGRRVQISNFKNTLMVGIREYYEKDGKMLPGKKGISLTTDQFASLLEVVPQIEAALKSRGVDLPRPVYDSLVASTEEQEDDIDDDDDEEESAEKQRSPEELTCDDAEGSKERIRPSAKLDGSKLKKANHEATDDEDD